MPSTSQIVMIVIALAVLGLGAILFLRSNGAIKETFEAERPCTVYYLSNMDTQKRACDAGYMDEPVAVLQDRRNTLLAQNSQDPAVLQQIDDLAVAISAPRNQGVCKFDFTGWTEYDTSPFKNGSDTADIQNRNGILADGSPNPKSDQWAFCYRPVAGFDPVQFQNSTAASLYEGGRIIGDTKYRLDFNYLDYNNVREAYCKVRPAGLNANFPTENTPALLKLGFDAIANKITSVDLVVNNGNGMLITYTGARQTELEKAIFGRLFEVQLQGKNLVLVPKQSQMQLYKLQFDPCNGTTVTSNAPILVNFATLVSAGVSAINTVIMSNIADNMLQYAGSLSSLDNRINSLNATKNQLALDIELLTQKIANTETELNFTQGLLERRTPISMQTWQSNNWWVPSANVSNQAGFATFKEAVKTQAASSGANVRVQIVTTIGYGPTNRDVRTFYEYEGYIYLNAGTHRFKLNSDDAGEMYISEQPYTSGMREGDMQPTKLIATYYNMHGMGHQGTVVAPVEVPQGKQGYYRILIHWFEWRGGDGYRIYQSINGGAYNQPSSSMFFTASMTTTAADEASKLAKQNEKLGVEAEIAALVPIRRAMGSSIRAKAYEAVKAMADRARPSILGIQQLSNDNAFYIWPGDLGVPVRPNAVPNDAPQFIADTISDFNASLIEADPFVIDLQKPPEYTVMMWLKIQNPSTRWRQVFFHGTGDDWTDTGGDFNRADRTPGVWVWPARENRGFADGKVRMHFRHRAKSCKALDNPRLWEWAGDHNCGLDMYEASRGLPNYGEWFHYAVTIKTLSQHNASEISLYLNGQLHDQARLQDNNKFDWNNLYGKKLWIGTPQSQPLQATGPTYMQKAKWYSVAKTAQDVLADFQAGYVAGGPSPFPVPVEGTPSTLSRLFRDLVVAQVYPFMIGNVVYNVYIEPASAENGNQPWLLILNYNRNAGDNQPPKIRRSEANAFPQSLAKTAEGWGQVPKEVLANIPFRSVRFYGVSGTHKIHFTTTHPNVISYMKTGTGSFPLEQSNWYTLLSDHNSQIPQSAVHKWTNQGDWALNNAPFYIGSSKHWDAGLPQGNKYRWEVNDYPNDNRNATVHQVWIGL